MDTIWIIVLIAVAIIVIGGIVWAMQRQQAARVEEKREDAAARRDEARAKERQAEKARLEAEEQAERARREGDEAARLSREADEIDPDFDDGVQAGREGADGDVRPRPTGS